MKNTICNPVRLIILLLLWLSPLLVSAQHSLYILAEKSYIQGAFHTSDSLFREYINLPDDTNNFVDRNDTLGHQSFIVAEKFHKCCPEIAVFWYQKSLYFYRHCRQRESLLGYNTIYREMGIAHWKTYDTTNAIQLLIAAYRESQSDSITIKYLWDALYNSEDVGLLIPLAAELSQLRYGKEIIPDSLLVKINENSIENRLKNHGIIYDPQVLISGIDGLGVYAYDLKSFTRVKVFSFDSLQQIFCLDPLQLLDDTTLLVGALGKDSILVDPNNSQTEAFVDNYLYFSVNLRTLEKHLYKRVTTIDRLYTTSEDPNDVHIITRFYDLRGNVISTQDSAFMLSSANKSYRGNIYSNESTKEYPGCYYCYHYESRIVNGKKVVCNIEGMWVYEKKKKKRIFPYHLTYHGHYPIGYIEPDLSCDGNFVAYVYKPEAWEGEFFGPDSAAIFLSSLNILDLRDMKSKKITQYDVVAPEFSNDTKYLSYFTISFPYFKANILELYDLQSGRIFSLGHSDFKIWYSISRTE